VVEEAEYGGRAGGGCARGGSGEGVTRSKVGGGVRSSSARTTYSVLWLLLLQSVSGSETSGAAVSAAAAAAALAAITGIPWRRRVSSASLVARNVAMKFTIEPTGFRTVAKFLE